MVEKEAIEEAQSKLQSEFLQILRSRRPAQVPLTVQLAKPVANPLFQDSPPSIKEGVRKGIGHEVARVFMSEITVCLKRNRTRGSRSNNDQGCM
ncbi:hypothetical protein GLYMA_04G081300v4 [Glycine max]|uniref:Uncharacterized protein n=1 Tax=Glycine max TaxID=3847 RepID=A0A0R0K9Z4_SOYBN|nr:hypothetical protein GYH30_009306 [Glycine max]KRH62034.1 hypothetical protein GLYMA_04G081300v4 [Glycine max]